MSIQIQRRRGTKAQHDTFTGAVGEITHETTFGILRAHDGLTAGGIPQRRTIPIEALCRCDGSAEDALFVAGVATANTLMPGVPISLNGKTLVLESAALTGADIYIVGPGTIKHANNATDRAISNVGGSMRIEGVTLDGNRANQTLRHDMLEQSGGDIILRDNLFTGTVSSGFRTNGVMGIVDVERNKWRDMAEHGGTTGQGSHAAYIVCTSIETLRVAFNDVRHGTPSAPGYSPSGFFISTPGGCAPDILFNYFENIGQNVTGNFSGCIDFYTSANAGTVIGNRAVNSYWMPFKLQIGDKQIVHSNRVEGLHPTAAGGMAFLQYARSFGAALKYAVAGPNYIDCGAGVNLPAIILQGDDEYYSDGFILRDFVIPRCGKVLSAEYVQHVELLNCINDAQESATGSVEIKNTDQGTGAPASCRFVIKGGRLAAGNSAAVFARTNVTNLDLTVEGVSFVGGGGGSPIVTMRNGKALRFINNDFDTGAVTQLDAQTITVARLDGNRGPSGTLGAASIGDLDYGYNPGCWDFAGSKTFDPPFIAAGTVSTTTVTVTGAAFSLHEAEAKFSLAPSGIIISAWVSGANTVTVQFYNPTAGAINLASGTLSARVKRRLPLAA